MSMDVGCRRAQDVWCSASGRKREKDREGVASEEGGKARGRGWSHDGATTSRRIEKGGVQQYR